MSDSALYSLYMRRKKTIRIIPAWTILPALDRQARPRRDIMLGEILRLDNLRFRQRIAKEVTQQSVQMYLVYLALALFRGKSGWATSQYHGVCSPLNFVSHIIPPPGVTSRGVTAFVLYYSLYILLLLLVTSLNILILLLFIRVSVIALSPPQVWFVPSTLGWWQHYLPYPVSLIRAQSSACVRVAYALLLRHYR